MKLFLMMVLEFFIWGAWFPLIFAYLPSLGFTPAQQSWVLNAFPIAAIVGMFFSNQFADRNFAAERFLSVSHLIGGLAMLSLAAPSFAQQKMVQAAPAAQVARADPANGPLALALFRSNRMCGALVFLAMLVVGLSSG